MNNYFLILLLLSTVPLFSMEKTKELRDYSDYFGEYVKALENKDRAKINALLEMMHQNYTEDYTEFKIRKKNNGDDEAPGYDELY